MAKKNPKSSSSRNTDQTENTHVTSEWMPTNLLDPRDSNLSTMKSEKLEEVKLLFDGNVDAVIPHSSERADWFRPNWVCFYYYPFDIGMTFPFSKLVSDVLDFLNISPGQLMPLHGGSSLVWTLLRQTMI